jgi:2,3,4,5-tetrahydropyridine-2,6-dicarboxylate N-succinyltransferase
LTDGKIVKAIELSGRPGILFRRHSVHGNVEAVPRKSSTFAGLNPQLHQYRGRLSGSQPAIPAERTG